MNKLIVTFIIVLGFSSNCWSQTDSLILQFENEEEILEFIYFRNNKECLNRNIELVDVDVTHCDSIDNKAILPSISQKIFIRSRIVDFTRNNDTLSVSLIGISNCCFFFFATIKCVDDTTLNLQYFRDGGGECFCGGCPYLFTYTIIDKDKRIKGVLLNGNEIELTDEIYRNETEERKRNIISGKTLVKTYSDSELVLEKHYNRKGELLLTKMYCSGKEIELK